MATGEPNDVSGDANMVRDELRAAVKSLDAAAEKVIHAIGRAEGVIHARPRYTAPPGAIPVRTPAESPTGAVQIRE